METHEKIETLGNPFLGFFPFREKPIFPFFHFSIFPFFKVSIFCTFQCFHFSTFSHVSIFSCFKVFHFRTHFKYTFAFVFDATFEFTSIARSHSISKSLRCHCPTHFEFSSCAACWPPFSWGCVGTWLLQN